MANSVKCKQQAKGTYKQNAGEVIERAKLRQTSDATCRKKNLAAHRLRLLQGESYKEKNRGSSRINTKRRLIENEAYTIKNRERALVNIRRRLKEDDAYRKKEQ